MTTRTIIIASTLVVTFVGAYVLLWSPLPVVSSWWSAEDYDWRDPLHKRNRIADWLVLTQKLDDLSRTEVESLLGAAHETRYFDDWDMVYQLGHERGFISIDSEWLVINLNENSIVSEYAIVRD